MRTPLNVDGDKVAIDLFVDQSSVEIFTKDGAMAMTNLVFPNSIYDALTVSGATYEAQVRSLTRIW